MGMFNEIMVPCSKCGKRVEFQTKSGSCMLKRYNLENAPNREVEGILGDTEYCKCGHIVKVELDEEAEVKIKLKIT